MSNSVKYQSLASLPQMFFEQAAAMKHKPHLWVKNKQTGSYESFSWAETRAQVLQLAHALERRGVGAGDRVVIISENRPEWLIADLAIMALGAISVPAYTTNREDDHLYIFNNCAAKAVIVSTEKLASPALQAAARAPSVEFAIAMEEPTLTSKNIRLFQWNDVLRESEGKNLEELERKAAQLSRSETCCIIYTSGTGGAPKGVMLSHGAILKNCEGAYYVLKDIGLDNEIFLSFLPLSHSYEHTAGQFFPISIGAQIYYAEGIESLSQNLAEARPTIMVAVPRLYEVLHQKIEMGIKRAPRFRQKLFHDALALGKKRFLGESLSFWQKVYNFFLDKAVRRKVRGRFGGRLKALVSGGAPLNYEIGLFFTALGMNLLQGYGQTEAAPVVSCNSTKKKKIHTVGAPMKDVEVKIADDGEILVRGELLMNGYWGEPELTKRTIVDGWLHTGDIGRLDEDGHIQITDRKKDIIVNAGGDNISPARVEGFLTLQPEIHQAMVYGDRHPYLVGLIIPAPEFIQGWAAERGLPEDPEKLMTHADFRAAILAAVERVNQRLSVIERVRKFELIAEPFTVDNGMMTPTLKIKRHVVKQQYGEQLEALYTSSLKKTG